LFWHRSLPQVMLLEQGVPKIKYPLSPTMSGWLFWEHSFLGNSWWWEFTLMYTCAPHKRVGQRDWEKENFEKGFRKYMTQASTWE
jgi:hypothetical protein